MYIQIFPCGPLQTNAILIGCKATQTAAAIDPSQGSANLILQAAFTQNLTIKKILLTHSHWDHIADAYTLKQKTGALLFVHALDEGNVIKPGSDGLPVFFPIPAAEPDGHLEEGKAVDVGHLHIEIIHTPGHSPGSVCLYLKDQKVLISGDTLFKGSIGRLDLATGQPSLMWDSLKKLEALPPNTRVLPGHGGETTLAQESWLKYAKEKFS